LPYMYSGGRYGQTSTNEGFSFAFASDHSLYAAHANTAGSVIVRKFNGTGWDNVPSVATSMNAFPASVDQMAIVTRPNECLVIYKPQGVSKIIAMQWKRQL
jgi:hypothetical protein